MGAACLEPAGCIGALSGQGKKCTCVGVKPACSVGELII
jgi:hypothetical protein